MPIDALIVGGGRIGVAIAQVLVDARHDVTILELRPDRVGELREEAPGATVVPGSGTDPAQLEAAGARTAAAVAAVTGRDETNLLVTSLARFEFGVPRTIARIIDPRKAWMYTEVMGVDVALNQADLMARMVAEELSLGQMTTLLKLRRGQFELVEERVHPQAKAAGMKVRDLPLPPDCVLVAVLRDGETIITRGGSRIEAGDELLAVVHSGQAAELAALLGPPG